VQFEVCKLELQQFAFRQAVRYYFYRRNFQLTSLRLKGIRE